MPSIARAQHNAAVQALWSELVAVGDCLPLGQVPEAARLFSEFEPLPAAGRA